MRDVVRRQADTGVDVVGDGEFGKPTDTTNDADHGHGVWALYVRERLTGFEWVDGEKASPSSKDRSAFPAFYGSGGRRQPAEGGHAGEVGTTTQVFACTGPIAYCGQELVARDIAHLTAALDGADAAGAFLPAVSPGSLPSLIPDRHHPDEDAYRQALAAALRTEYRAIVDAGFILQIDDPGLGETWDMLIPAPPLEEYRKTQARNLDALNHALAGIPRTACATTSAGEAGRARTCKTSSLRDVVDLVLRVKAQAYSIEAATPRHVQEWRVWEDVKLPDGKVLIPGVIAHTTAWSSTPSRRRAARDLRRLVGRERVMAGADCGAAGGSGPTPRGPGSTPRLEGARSRRAAPTGSPDDNRRDEAQPERILTTHGAACRGRPISSSDRPPRRRGRRTATQAQLAARGGGRGRREAGRDGIDVVSDGEMGKVGYATYVKDRLSGFAGRYPRPPHLDVAPYPEFRDAMARMIGRQTFKRAGCVGPVELIDRAAIEKGHRESKRGARSPFRASRVHERGVARAISRIPVEPLLSDARGATSTRSRLR